MYLRKGIHEGTIEIDDNNLSILLHLDKLNKIDGLYEIRYIDYIEDDLEVITGVIDDDLNQVVPIQKEKISRDAFDKEGNSYGIKLFPNKKAIYMADKNEYYIIDLENTKFKSINGKVVPENYVENIDFCYNLGDGNIIYSKGGKSVLYDVINLKAKSSKYDEIILNNNNNILLAYYYEKDIPFCIKMTLHLDGTIDSEATINNIVDIYIPNGIIGDREAIINYAISCLSSISKKQDGISMQ